MEGLTAGEMEARKRNSTLQQSAWDALLRNDGLKQRRDEEREQKEEGEIQYACWKLAAVIAVMDEALHVTE